MIEKLDIINNFVYCYNDQLELEKTLEISQFQGVDFSYVNGSKMFTLNINNPIKRAIYFKELNDLNTTSEFVEYPYEDMTAEQKVDFDNFVEQANNA
jgi:hypothetical protein